jgi:hypothetical protein
VAARGKRPDDVIAVEMTRTELLALEKVATTGLRVTEVLNLIPATMTAERALNRLRQALA